MRKGFFLIALGTVASSCMDGGQREATVEAGPTHSVTTERELEGLPTWRLEAEPYFVAGEREGDPDHALFRVQYARELSEGRVLVSSQANEIRIYGADGELLEVFGREGEGPGEYRQLWNVFSIPGDTLVALDAATRRWTILDHERTVVGTYVIEANWSYPAGAYFLPPASVFGFELESALGAEDGTRVVQAHLARVDFLRGTKDTLRTFDGYRTQVRDGSWNSAPFSTAPILSGDGERVFAASTGVYEIFEFNPAGDLQRVLEMSRTPRTVTRGMREAWCEEVGAVRCNSERFPPDFPDALPVISKLVATTAGTVWARLYESPLDEADINAWHVFGDDGKVLALSETPKTFRLTQVAGDRVIGVWTSDLGVQSVRGYHLVRE